MHVLVRLNPVASVFLLLLVGTPWQRGDDGGVVALDNGLARRPPMGWMSWQRYRCNTDCTNYPDDCISEKLLKKTANALVNRGFQKAGYTYVIVDDCWPAKYRDPVTQALLPDPGRFPSGMKAIGDYLHSLQLKFGVYLDFGTLTCGGFPGSLFHLERDAQTLAEWGADYTKVDGCYSDTSQQPEGYEVFGRYLNQTGRPIVYSCSYPAYADWQAKPGDLNWSRLAKTCNLWRMLGDIQDSWGSLSSLIRAYQQNHQVLESASGPGAWNDPDMLLAGNYGLSRDQQKTQMALWAMFAAPLLISADVEKIDEWTFGLLTNKAIIRVNQDALGKQGRYVKTLANNCLLWVRSLGEMVQHVAIAVNYFSDGGGPIQLSVSLNDFGVTMADFGRTDIEPLLLQDVFTDSPIKNSVYLNTSFPLTINPSGVVMYEVYLAEHKIIFQ